MGCNLAGEWEMLTIQLAAFAALEGEQVDSAYQDDYSC